MTYHYFQYNERIDAGDMNDNFLHIGQGDRLPMGATSLDNTTSVFNLGSSSYQWDNLYCDKLFVHNAIDNNNQLWVLEAETILTATASSVTFTGLNGDDASEYIVKGRIFTTFELTRSYIDLETPQASLGSYAYQYIWAENGTSVGAYQGVSDGIKLIEFITTTNMYFVSHIYAKTNANRIVISSAMSANSTCSSITSVYETTSILDESTTTITSIEIGYGEWLAGTRIELWRKQ